jgi:hypothetical protein
VLLLEDAGREGVCVVAFEDGDGFLQDDDAVVELLVDEVDGAAGDLDAVVEGLVLRVEAGCGKTCTNSGESRRMYPARQTRST